MPKLNQRTLEQLAFLQAGEIQTKTAKQFEKERHIISAEIINMNGHDIKEWAETQNFLTDVNSHENQITEIDRTMYCSSTGQPVATMTLDTMSLYRRAMDGNANRAQVLDDLSLFAQPAPHWRRISPEQLKRNSEIDPWGYLVYFTDRICAHELRMRYQIQNEHGQWRWKQLTDQLAWKRSKVIQYQGLKDNCETNLILRLNEIATIIDGEIGFRYLPIPITKPEELASSEMLRRTIRLLHAYWSEYQVNKSSFQRKFKMLPNPIAKRVSVLAVKGQSDEILADYLRISVSDAMRAIFGTVDELADVWNTVDVSRLEKLDTAIKAENKAKGADIMAIINQSKGV